MEETNARFTSEVKLSLNTFQEYRKMFLDRYTRNIVIRLFIIIFSLSQLAVMDDNDSTRIYLLFAVVLTVTEWYSSRKYRDGGLEYKQILHQNEDTVPHQILYFREEELLRHNTHTGAEKAESYHSFCQIWESRNLLLLVTDLKLYHIIDKRTLTGGTSVELIQFLREKCPNLKKKVSGGTFGRFVRRFMWATVAFCSVWALLSCLQIPQRMFGRLTNRVPVRQMAEELAELDITISSEALDKALLHEASCTQLFSAYPGASKVLDLLCWEGEGTYEKIILPGGQDGESYFMKWTPSLSGVYWFHPHGGSVGSIYTNLLNGIDAMDTDLTFTRIAEDYTKADIRNDKGSVTCSFYHQGQRHFLQADYRGSQIDTDVLFELGQILAMDDDPKELWFAYAGEGFLLYYGTMEQRITLERKTGIDFYYCMTFHMDQ